VIDPDRQCAGCRRSDELGEGRNGSDSDEQYNHRDRVEVEPSVCAHDGPLTKRLPVFPGKPYPR